MLSKNQDALEPKDLLDENRDDNIEMTRYYTDKQPTTLSSTKRICLFAKIFRLFLEQHSMFIPNITPIKKVPIISHF